MPLHIKSLVRSGSINYALAIQIKREHGVYADREAARLMKKAKESGKKKITKSVAQPQFNATRARRLCELLYDAAPMVREEGDVLLLLPGTREEINTILNEYRQQHPQVASGEDQ
ncbi:hypothetical protein ACUNHW_22575 [Serratia sp. IR-2025]